MVATFGDYKQGGAQTGPSAGSSDDTNGYWSLDRLKRSYHDFLGSKRDEIKEQQEARRYRHGSQWTQEQISVLNKRRQPVVTNNVISRKINGVIGLIEKLRQAPKAYARTPKEEQGADLATAVVRYVLDEQRFKEKSPIAAENCAVDGYGGIEIILEQGDQGDPEVGFEVLDTDEFFYDPRSFKGDFSDCRYMGRAKWMDLESAKEMFPDKAADLDDMMGDELSTNSDREQKWFFSEESVKRIRVVDEWYRKGGEWYWCIYTGGMKLQEGKSPFTDEKKRTFPKFVMFSAYIDQDGDRYGFVRNFKSMQDEINQRRSKGLHLLNQRRIMAEDGAFDDIEKARVESARADGVVIYNKGFEAKFDDQVKMLETDAQLKFLQEAKEELEQFGPTLSLIGEVGGQQSGRAISLQQQAGIAQLGPFMVNYRSWKLRVYRAIWNAVRTNWTAERWIRVTDDETSVAYVGLNQIGTNPQTGMPAIVNNVSALDVDIIMDEGPDSINMMADTFDALNAIAQNGAQIPPDVLLELAPGIDAATRKRLIERLRTPDPMQQQAQQAELALAMAKVKDTEANAASKMAVTQKTATVDAQETASKVDLNKAQTIKTLIEANQPPEGDMNPQEDMVAQQEQQRKDQEFYLKQSEAAAKAARDEEKHQMEMQKQHMELQQRDAKLKMDMEAHHANMQALSQEQTMNSGGEASSGGSSAPARRRGPTSLEDVGRAITEGAAQNKKMTETAHSLMEHHTQAANAMALAAQTIAQAVGEIKQMSAPKKKKIVRDKTGRISEIIDS